ncbi:MAG: hypothetical protein SP4CHLAM5_11600 [Chlamydiia bacterium]|nr:hypothetical protein [Chlamydiia bacterium]MCH9619016.1 hypothetical protein [Chlamydiia bacterium]MCH9624039.1 hypothetical protein [Chlamydiia bacterium]
MGNKPHRNKKLMKKALRKAAQIDTSKKNSPKKYHHLFDLKPFHQNTAKEMLYNWKKEVEHIHLKNKPHHHKRTTPGSVDAENPLTISGHSINDKTMKTGLKTDIQKAADMGRKYLGYHYKKAA